MGLLIIQALVELVSRFTSLKFIKNSDALQEISGMKLADRVSYEIARDFVASLQILLTHYRARDEAQEGEN